MKNSGPPAQDGATGAKNVLKAAELSEVGRRLYMSRLKAERPGLAEADYEALFYRRVRAAKDAALLRAAPAAGYGKHREINNR
jgi:hypothetical protein